MSNELPELEAYPEDSGRRSGGIDQMRSNLGEAWATRPGFRVMAILLPIAAVAALVMAFFSSPRRGPNETVLGGPQINGPETSLDMAMLSPAEKAALAEKNRIAAEQAAAQGGSTIPNIIPDTTTPDTSPDPAEAQPDPLKVWQDQLAQDAQQQQEAPPPNQKPNYAELPPLEEPQTEPVDDGNTALAQAMLQTMADIDKQRTPVASQTIIWPTNPAEQALANQQAAFYAPNGTVVNPDGSVVQNLGPAIIKAGQIVYAQMLVEANSDIPGPVVATILSGPLAGGKAIGQFTAAREALTLQFSTIALGDKEYSVNALAIDPDTTVPGVVTDIDNHYFVRVVLPAAAAFIEGVGNAIANEGTTTTSGLTTTTTSPQRTTEEQLKIGAAEAASKAGEILSDKGNRPITIRVAAGTPVGLLFVNAVREGQTQ